MSTLGLSQPPHSTRPLQGRPDSLSSAPPVSHFGHCGRRRDHALFPVPPEPQLSVPSIPTEALTGESPKMSAKLGSSRAAHLQSPQLATTMLVGDTCMQLSNEVVLCNKMTHCGNPNTICCAAIPAAAAMTQAPEAQRGRPYQLLLVALLVVAFAPDFRKHWPADCCSRSVWTNASTSADSSWPA